PEKRLSTAYEGLHAFREASADAIVGLGGGSSLDVATVIAVLAGDDRDPGAVGRELAETGSITVPEGSLPPILAVPTTLPGAELSGGAGVTASPDAGLVDRPASGGVSDPRLMPAAVTYDPALVATTPPGILRGSAMNGFDKGVETLYARNATPVTDATATRGLGLLVESLPALGEVPASGEDRIGEEVLAPILKGIMLVQYGVSRPGETTLSIVHAFGHGLTRTYGVQQGAAHGIVAPHVLAYLFERVPGRRDLLAEALGVGEDETDPDETAAAVVDAVAGVRDALDLPTRLRDVDGPEPVEFPAVAAEVLDDPFMRNAPRSLDPTAGEIEGVLREAY
ncbi:MAG: iron-containing alcohol dehydrogenase, partial [Halobacteriales archaeon]